METPNYQIVLNRKFELQWLFKDNTISIKTRLAKVENIILTFVKRNTENFSKTVGKKGKAVWGERSLIQKL